MWLREFVYDAQHPAGTEVDICNACHPFYTGKLKFVDTAGRIEKFKNKFAAGYASLKRGKKAEAVGADAEG